MPSGPACSPVGILPLWLEACGERACWQDVGLLVVSAFASVKSLCWWNIVRILLVKRTLLAKRALLAKRVSPGQTQTPGRTGFPAERALTAPTRITGPNANCWPERNLLDKNKDCYKVTEFFSFGASDHDGVFSFPAALGGAGAYLFRWLAVTHTLLDVQVIITRSSHSKGFSLDRAEPARWPFPGAISHSEA